jgi:hypothetical protein
MLDSCQLNVYRSLTPLSTIFSYIFPVSFIFLEETWIIGDNHRPVPGYLQTGIEYKGGNLTHNLVMTVIDRLVGKWIWFMVLNATFNNISVISWRSVLLVEETGVPGENH